MILTDTDIKYTYSKDIPGIALAWVIDGDCVYDAPLSAEHAQIFLETDEVVDISNEHPEHSGITVRLLHEGESKLELMTSEYFGSILLSNPLVVRLDQYPYGLYVVSPHAKFDGEKFIILNRDVSDLAPMYVKGENSCCPG